MKPAGTACKRNDMAAQWQQRPKLSRAKLPHGSKALGTSACAQYSFDRMEIVDPAAIPLASNPWTAGER